MNALVLSSRVSIRRGEGQYKNQGLRINHNGHGVAGAIADPGTALEQALCGGIAHVADFPESRQSIQRVLALTNSRMPCCESSRP